METYNIQNDNIEDVLKQVKKARLENKNKWYQVEIVYKGFKYQLKIYNTWIQIFRKIDIETNTFCWDTPSPMDMKVGEFMNYIRENLV